MDFWLANMVISVFGIVFSTVAIVGVTRSVVNSPMRKAKAEIMKQRAFGEVRDARTDGEILNRLHSLEQLVSFQNDELRKLTEENEFFRRLLTDRAESSEKPGRI